MKDGSCQCWRREKVGIYSGRRKQEVLIEDKERLAFYVLYVDSTDDIEHKEQQALMAELEMKRIYKPWKVNSGGTLLSVSYEFDQKKNELHEIYRQENKPSKSTPSLHANFSSLSSSPSISNSHSSLSSAAIYQYRYNNIHNPSNNNHNNSVLESSDVLRVREALIRKEREEERERKAEEKREKEKEKERDKEFFGEKKGTKKKKKKAKKEMEPINNEEAEEEEGRKKEEETEKKKEREKKMLEERIKRLLYTEVERRVVMDGLQVLSLREKGVSHIEWMEGVREKVKDFLDGNQKSKMKEAAFFHSFCNLKQKIKVKKETEERKAKEKRKEREKEFFEDDGTGRKAKHEEADEYDEDEGMLFFPPPQTSVDNSSSSSLSLSAPSRDLGDDLFSFSPLNLPGTTSTEPIFSFDDFND